MKERMTEIGSRWQRQPLKEKDRYKKIAEEKQRQYKVQLEQWLAVRTVWGWIDKLVTAHLQLFSNIHFDASAELVFTREKHLQRI